MKRCSSCKQEKPLTDFYKHKLHQRQQDCKICQNTRSREIYWADAERRKAHNARARNNHLIKKYGITTEDYEGMLASHNGVCWICDRPPKNKRLCVDHCHKTGTIRGLLCYRCNYKLLPCVRDNPELLQRAAEYLRTTL